MHQDRAADAGAKQRVAGMQFSVFIGVVSGLLLACDVRRLNALRNRGCTEVWLLIGSVFAEPSLRTGFKKVSVVMLFRSQTFRASLPQISQIYVAMGRVE